GGAVSDALLIETTKEAGNVVVPSPAEHGSMWEDPDHVVRSLPLYLDDGGGSRSSFGLALAAAFLQVLPDQIVSSPSGQIMLRNARAPDGRTTDLPLPADRRARLLVNYSTVRTPDSLPTLSFATVFDAINDAEQDRLQEWMADKIVLLLPQSSGGAVVHRTATGQDLSGSLLQAHLLNTLVTRNWIRRVSESWHMTLTLVLCGLVAWTLLSVKGPKAVAITGGLLAGYWVAVLLALPFYQWVLPVVIPTSAILLVFSSVTWWTHLSAGHRMRVLEQDMLTIQGELVAVREALVRRENTVEGLQEDLEAARLVAAQSTGKQEDLLKAVETLNAQIVEAQTQEEAARERLQELERALASVQAVTMSVDPLGDTELERVRQECEQFGIISRNTRILSLFRDLKKGARSTLSVLIIGEPGTGKELLARAVHRLSPRATRPFIAVNMAAISPELCESELFGHVRGSFTGALNDRKGYFELAHQGTLFLDEIGDLRLDHQSKLLRVLQDRTFYRVGATTPTTVDVRIVAATNKDLPRGVSEGWFREDLYFRLKGLILRLPPLRERPDDIAPLAEHSLREAASQIGRANLQLSQGALAALREHEWKGNVRELRQCLEQAVALTDGPVISRADLRLEDDSTENFAQLNSHRLLPDPAGDAAVLACLRQHGFDMQATATTLGWDRSTVTQRLKGMCFQALREADGDQVAASSALAGDPALVRTITLKLMAYYDHLIKTTQDFCTAEEAILDCKRRFKNIPDRHFRAVEFLIRRHFSQKSTMAP
ncbi:MAG: sigma 54-interacting transcriptional regulator, partial [Nitrospiraceae bacterium]